VKNKVVFILLFALLLSSCAPLADVPTPAALQPTYTVPSQTEGSATPAITATPETAGTPTAIPTIAFTCQCASRLPAFTRCAQHRHTR